MKNILNTIDKADVIQRIESLSLNSEKQWGKMNISQMIVHCTDQIRAAVGEKEVRDKGNWFQKTIIKNLALYVIKQAPKGKVKTAHEFSQEQGKGGTIPKDIDTDKKMLIDAIHRFAKVEKYYPHPVFGQMSQKEWARLIYKHLDHHLKQFNA
jgi:hypothetical protein